MKNLKNIKGIKGYKVFNPDWTCRGFQYEVGKTFKYDGNIKICGAGFHFCQKASDCFSYYDFNSKNKVAEVLATGLVETENYKSVTDEIKIIREIPWEEVLTIVNEGNNCTGLCNTGDKNTGDYNTGDKNTGDCNIGGYNIGNCNTGNCNIGDWNTGDWNVVNNSTGLFNTKQKTIDIFNEPSNWTLQDWFNSDIISILNWNFESSIWIYEKNMTDEEKETHPEYKTTGGYLKVFEFKEACKNMWDNMTDYEKHRVVTELPNFNADIFKEITGIDINK